MYHHVSHLGQAGRFHLSTALPFEGEESPKRSESRIPVVLPRGVSVETFFGWKWAEFPSCWVPDHSTHSTSTVVSWLDSRLILLGGAGCAHLEKWWSESQWEGWLSYYGKKMFETSWTMIHWLHSWWKKWQTPILIHFSPPFETSPFRKKNKDPALQVCPKGSLCLIAWQGAYFHTCHMCHKGRCRKVKSCQIYIQIPFIFPVF